LPQPIFERLVAQPESVQQVACVDLRCAAEIAGIGTGGEPLEDHGVDLDSLRIERKAVVSLDQRRWFDAGQNPPQLREGLPQAVARFPVAAATPQQAGQLAAGMSTPSRQG